MKAPCLNCADRVVGCHAECERYKDFKEFLELAKAQNALDRMTGTYTEAKNRKLREKLLRRKDGRVHDR